MKELIAKMEVLVERGLIPLAEARKRIQAIINKFDPIIIVDRGIDLIYPDFIREPLYEDLEKTGPIEINIVEAEQWLHEKQHTGGFVLGYEIHEGLIAKNLLDSCYGLRELNAIQARGVGFFHQYFARKVVFGWRGTARNHVGNPIVPYLIERSGKVIQLWYWLGLNFYSNNPALRRAS